MRKIQEKKIINRKINNEPIISIILPAYNVGKWLPKCISSIEEQIFFDYEVIAIDDGSSDETGKLLDDWASRDGRIRVIHKKNQGVFIARNEGVKLAKGNYLSFIDSDDWVAPTFLQKLYNLAHETDADVSECDFYRYNNKTGELTCRRTYGQIGLDYSRKEHMIYAPSMLWKCLFKKDFWLKNNINIPNCLGSAHVVYVQIFLLGAKWVNIHEPLYYYRRMREGSIVDINGKNSSEQYKMGIQELEALKLELKKRDVYEAYEEEYKKIVSYRLSDMLAAQYTRVDEESLKKQVIEYKKYINDSLGIENKDYFVVGGYNLNRITSYLPLLQNPLYRYNFSSLISMTSESVDLNVKHKNQYRQKMIDKDIESSFVRKLLEIKPMFIVIDLIDERSDLIKAGNGYITKSEALMESDYLVENMRIVEWNSEEYKELFKNAVKTITDICENNNIKIIVVENYLCISHGNVNITTEYAEKDNIIKVNEILKDLYALFKEICPEAILIETINDDNYFTDDEYEYGVKPWHFNERLNRSICGRIWEMIR